MGHKVKKKSPGNIQSILWTDGIKYSNSYYEEDNFFTFLNISHRFGERIDWNYDKYGKLWSYNLNYFDFLNQLEISKNAGLFLIRQFVRFEDESKDGKEPYPVSLRILNWVKFLSKNQVKDEIISSALYHDCRILLNNLEFHLLGNHLLENAFALLFGSYYFQDEYFYKRSRDLLVTELNHQVMQDGAHFELSPMYHQIILFRLLDSIYLIRLNPTWKRDDLLSLLESKASRMLSWLSNITYANGDVPMVNDSTFDIAPSSDKLFTYSKYLGIAYSIIPLADSGYRKVTRSNYEIFIDIGNVGPDFQPGHAHSDTLNFELRKEDNPIIVDTGISTYEKNSIRQHERSTSSHNTVKIGVIEQTEVWGGFRVAKRAKISNLKEGPNLIQASHDGYLSSGYNHTRSFLWSEKHLILLDEIDISTGSTAKAYFHLHFSVTKPLVDGNRVKLNPSGVIIEFSGLYSISIKQYRLSAGFNKTNLAYKIVVIFDQSLKTIISL
ncbi:heparinase II/III family protein [Schleiferiaceae bacterium]|nr:heparinase II/III family protein [Schleiferiaceae bacterium]